MTRIRKGLFTFIVLFSISFSQSRMVNQKPLTELIHENIQKALLMNQFSEGARLIDEIQQNWSNNNNQWENWVRYTYEYSLAKRSAKDPTPGLDRVTKWKPNGISWEGDEYTKYEYDDDGNPKTATTYKWPYNEPVVKIEYEGFHNGIATNETRYSPIDWIDDDYAFEWVESRLVERTFNSDGYPSVITESNWDESFQGWVDSRFTTIEYDPDNPGCPKTYTKESDPNDPTGKRSATQQSPTGVTDIVPTWREEYIYDQEACTNDVPPYMQWGLNSSCNETYTDMYAYDYDTASLEHWMYKVTDYNTDNCLAHEKTTTWVDGYPLSWMVGYPFSKGLFWYNTPDGTFPSKLSTAYDNSETRLIRVESAFWNGSDWGNSRRGLYAYEGMSSLDTEDISLVPIGFELKQNYPNPFNPTTSISYELPQESNVSIKIYNSLGHEIKTLVNEYKSVGQYQVTWNGISDSGVRVSDGTYFCQLKAGDFTQTRKMVLLK